MSRDFQNLGQSEPGDTNEQKKRRVAIVHLTYSSDPVYSKIGLQRGYQFALRLAGHLKVGLIKGTDSHLSQKQTVNSWLAGEASLAYICERGA